MYRELEMNIFLPQAYMLCQNLYNAAIAAVDWMESGVKSKRPCKIVCDAHHCWGQIHGGLVFQYLMVILLNKA